MQCNNSVERESINILYIYIPDERDRHFPTGCVSNRYVEEELDWPIYIAMELHMVWKYRDKNSIFLRNI